MSKLRDATPEEKAKLIVEKKASKTKYKNHVRELAINQKKQTKIRKQKHKEIIANIKSDLSKQKEYQKELKDYKKADLQNAPERVNEVRSWYNNLETKTKSDKKSYKKKLAKAKNTYFDFSGEIKLENVSFTYGINTPFEFRALNGTNLTIQKGKITAVIGMTGSGKSTLIQLTNGLITTETGRTIVGNYPILASTKKIKEVKDLRREVGLVFQFPEYQLFQDTIEKDIAFGPINLGADKEESLKKVPDLLKMVDLPTDYAKRSPFDLSGGQKRRVAIAGIIAMDGNTLVLDEPTGGLDPQGEEDFMRLFYNLNKEKKKRIVIVTHNMDHVLQIADEVIVMHKGRVIAKDSPFKIFSNKELLEKIEIEPPKLYKVAHGLKEKGIDITAKEFRTIKELALAIKESRTKLGGK